VAAFETRAAARKLRRVLVLCASAAVFVVDQLRRRLGRLVGVSPAGTCVVLEYHAVPAEHRARFASQMDMLRRIAIPLPTDSRSALTPSRWHVAITFDDGLTSFLENAVPELEKREIPATVFVVTDRLGTVPNWTSYLPGGLATEPMLDAEQLRALPANVLIGSHGASHAKLTELNDAEARHEIEGSRRQLEAIIGRQVTLFSYPYGAFADHLNDYCKEAGYERIFTNLPVLAFTNPGEFVSGRVEAKPTDSSLEFRLKVAGAYRWLPYAFSLKRALRKVLTKKPTNVEAAGHESLRLP
jgi:peptidoglycan/xylan/chitin deacetylase (PgdA/CDA1 family)